MRKDIPDGVCDVLSAIEDAGGTIEEIGGPLPDGSGFAVASTPLPADHWLTRPGYSEPPMPWRIGVCSERTEQADKVRAAAMYAIRASTMNGKIVDFDPDAMVQNFVVGMLGYWTDDGRSKL